MLRLVRLLQVKAQEVTIYLYLCRIFSASLRCLSAHLPSVVTVHGPDCCVDCARELAKCGGSQICRAVRLSWQPITPVQLCAMLCCPLVNWSPQTQAGFVAVGWQ